MSCKLETVRIFGSNLGLNRQCLVVKAGSYTSDMATVSAVPTDNGIKSDCSRCLLLNG